MSREIRLAAAVVPVLPDGRVLVGTRSTAARSFPGFIAFPGGAVDPEDAQIPRARQVVDEVAERAAALRELGEETGHWLLCQPGGATPSAAQCRAFSAARGGDSHRDRPREGLAATLRRLSLVLDDRRLVPLARWVTPDFLPHRFSVRQFLLPLDEQAPLTPPEDELEALRWMHARELVEAHRRGEALLLPPIRHVVYALAAAEAAGDDDDARLARLCDIRQTQPELRDLCAGVAVQPYRTDTLPPATHTNTVLLGERGFLIVDPATTSRDERDRFDATLARLAAWGRTPKAIVCSHHHHDHIGDVERVARRHGLPIWAHGDTAAHVPFAIDRALDDDEVLLTDDEEGAPHRAWRVLHTPGHAHGHLALYCAPLSLLFAGDLVASIGSILIDPPEGNMRVYLNSLDRIIGLAPRRVVPSHGPLLAAGTARLIAHRDHRLARLAQLQAALGPSPQSPEALVEALYGQDTPRAMFPLAARSLLASLELLCEEGRAERVGDAFRARA